MTQMELDHAVAARTGEEVRNIRHRGFSIVDLLETDFDPEPNDLPPSMVDWDDLEMSRNVAVHDRPCDLHII